MKRIPPPLFLVLASLCLLASCSSPAPQRRTDARVASASKRGRNAFREERYEAAVDFYRDALRRARMLNDPVGIGDSAYNLAVALAAMGQYDDALTSLREATAEFEPDSACRADVLLLEARIAVRQGRTGDAHATLDRVTSLRLRGSEADRVEALAQLQRAALWCSAKNAKDARTALTAARRKARRLTDQPLLAAEEETIDGRILLLEGNPRTAADRFDQAAARYEKSGRPTDVARLLGLAATSLTAAGDAAGAADRHYRAARSLYAQGRFPAALKQVDAALAAARDAKDEEIESRIRNLLEEIKAAVREASTINTHEKQKKEKVTP